MRLEAPVPLWEEIRADLLSTPDLERAGVGFAGRFRIHGGEHLLLRAWAPVPPEEYLVQQGYHLEVSPVFWARAAKRAQRSGEAIVILHSHPSDGAVPSFSPSDDTGERTLVPKIQARAPVPVAAVVVSPAGERARLSLNGTAPRALDVRPVGAVRPPRNIRPEARFDRQVRALGADAQPLLGAIRVGVVGAGGLGSHVLQQLIHLGIGDITVLDPDRVSVTNLSRLVGASRVDAWRHLRKTQVARRLARRVGGPSRIRMVDGSVVDEEAAHRLLGCDFVFGCTDNHWSRAVLNAIAFQYYVPVLDSGVELQAGGAMGGRVTWLVPGGACLWCMGILDAERVRVEQLPPATREAEIVRGYIQGLHEPAPAVVSINGVVASLAVTEFLARVTEFAGTSPRSTLLLYRVAEGVVRTSSPPRHPSCPTCSPGGLVGVGDLAMPPWRAKPGRH